MSYFYTYFKIARKPKASNANPAPSQSSNDQEQISRRANLGENSSAPVERELRHERPPPGALFDGTKAQRLKHVQSQKAQANPSTDTGYPPGYILSTIPIFPRLPRIIPSPSPLPNLTPSPNELHQFDNLFPVTPHPFLERLRQSIPLGRPLFPMSDQGDNEDGARRQENPVPPAAAGYVNQLSAETQEQIAGKRMPVPGAKDTPRFKGDNIRDFLTSCEFLFYGRGIMSPTAQIEIATLYVGYEIRRQWAALPEYSAGDWQAFKNAVQKLYNKGDQDKEFTLEEVEEVTRHFRARPIATKMRLMEFRREVVHKLQYLIDIGDVTQKTVLNMLQYCFAGPAWAAIYTDLRVLPIPPNNPLGQRWTLVDVVRVAEKYLEEVETFGGAPVVNGGATNERELVTPSTARVKIEDMHDQVASINSLTDTLKALEKARQDEMKEMEKARQEDTRRMMNLMERMSTARQVQVQQYPAQQMGYPQYIQQSQQAPYPVQNSGSSAPKGLVPMPANFLPQRRPAAVNGKCFFCDEPGHFLMECPEKNKLEKEGWIYKPANSNWYFLRNGISLTRNKNGPNPLEQVAKFQRESGSTLPETPQVQAYEGIQQEDFFAPSGTIDTSIYQQQSMVDPAYSREDFD